MNEILLLIHTFNIYLIKNVSIKKFFQANLDSLDASVTKHIYEIFYNCEFI